jgi:DNA polymerase-3 subunit beta
MRFITSQKQLIQTLNKVAGFVPTNPNHPILGTILLKADAAKQSLSARGFDLSAGALAQHEAQVLQEGSVCINKNILTALANKLSGDISIEVNEDFQVEIKSNGNTYNIGGQDPAHYPDLWAVDAKYILEFDAHLLKAVLAPVVNFASNEDTKQILTGICFKYKAGEQPTLTAAATDSHRLAVTSVELEPQEESESFSFVLKSVNVREVIKQSATAKRVLIKIDPERGVTFELDHQIYCRKLDGNYPQYEGLIPASFTTQFNVSSKDLLASLGRAMVLANPQSPVVIFEVENNNNRLTLTTTDQTNKCQEILDIESNSVHDIVIAFNNKYFFGIVNTIEDELISFNCNTPSHPVIIKPLKSKKVDCLFLVMPVQIIK